SAMAGRSELDQLGAGRSQALLVRPEINKHAHSLLKTDHCAEAILVVGHLVIDRVSLRLAGRHGGLCNVERATWQGAPRKSAVRVHCLKYAPTSPQRSSPGSHHRRNIRGRTARIRYDAG